MQPELSLHRRALPVALVVACACITATVRKVVADDVLSDAADLALTAGAFAAVLAALVVCVRLTWTTRRPAALAAPLALILTAALFLARSFDDVSVDAHSLMTSASGDGPAAIIALGPDGTDVRLAGEIHEGDAARLTAILDAHPGVTRIHLTSDGGLADEGQALGGVIAAHGLTTYVPDYCVSACTLAFVAGRERLALRDARLGFHAPYEEGLFGQTIRGDASGVRAAYAGAGLPADFVKAALEVGSDDMWYPEPDRLVAARVVTAFVDRARLPDSNLDGDPTLAGARAVVLSNVPMLAGLADTAPALVDRIAAWYLSAYRHDWSEARVAEGLHALGNDAVALTAAGAGDAQLVGLARFAAAAMGQADEDDCVAIGTQGDLVAAASVRGEDDTSADATAAALLRAAMTGQRGGAARATVDRIAFAGPRRETCAELRRAWASVLARPLPQAAALLRPRFTRWAQRAVADAAAGFSKP